MGTIQKRDDNAGKTTYQAKIRKTGFPPISQTFSTRADAERWMIDRESEMSRGVFVDMTKAKENTLGDLMKRYREEVSPKKKGGDIEVIRLTAMERDPIAKYAVANLTSTLIASYRDRRLKEVSGSTVNRDLTVLHHVLEVARKDWGIGTLINPVGDISRPKHNKPRDRRLRDGEFDLLLEACRKTRGGYLEVMLELAIETGMRQGEIVGLEWEQINLKDQVAYLRAGATKNDEQRGVPLSTKAVALLSKIPGEHKGRVWPGLTSEAVKRAFIRTRKRAGIEDFTFHDARHEATSRFVELGLTDSEVMSITGHKSSAMMKRYTHLNAKKLASKLG